ncbi:CNNM domain-containing protein [Gordonia caeni]|uniref:Hemolysin family protein n=1 Tax=Gordonia caeni TaxID=1007097 RepID=A0ABP7NUU3_9ACTN
MSDSPVLLVTVTVALIALSAFFVIIEFSLLAARPHRLEQQARTRRSARAALRGVNELTIMLAVAQLGITACTFALGAVTKPAVDAWLGPLLAGWGLPAWLTDAAAFGLALLVVTFLHLVVGEMAPKSWAIAHPELAANIIGVPARALAWLLRPLLSWINRIANRLVSASGYVPADRRALGGQDIDTIVQLVEHSAAVGTLDDRFRSQLAHVLELERIRVADLLPADRSAPTAVPESAVVGDVRAAAATSGHLRVLVERAGRTPGVVHVRDVLLEPDMRAVAELVREPLAVDAGTPVYEVLTRMRADGEPFAIATRHGDFAGVITIADVLARILPNGAELRL